MQATASSFHPRTRILPLLSSDLRSLLLLEIKMHITHAPICIDAAESPLMAWGSMWPPMGVLDSTLPPLQASVA